jgi:hypothetical protein
MSYWVHENSVGIRQAVIHLGECTLCEEGKKLSGQERWYGPFDSLDGARDISDSLEGIAMRAECKCVRKTVADVPSVAMLNEPLFRRPEPPKENKAEREEKEKGKKSAKPAAKTKSAKAKASRTKRYAAAGIAAVVVFTASIFLFPALSVVEAGNHSASTPFLLANDSPIPLTNIKAECTVELRTASVRLHNSHQDLADRLEAKKNVAIPCFQSSGGSTPQTSGMTLHLTVNYAIFGIHHVQQTFSFVAARTQEGFCRWVQTG